MEIVSGDIGGTNARFAIARKNGNGSIILSDMRTLKVAEHASFETVWEAYAASLGRPLPAIATIAVAGAIGGPRLNLTNNPWSIVPAQTQTHLGLQSLQFINDFAAIAYAVGYGAQHMPADQFRHVAGPDAPLPKKGAITILGPGTGLGVALLVLNEAGVHIVPTEGGHMDFAPLDTLEDTILAELRRQFRRVSVERIVSGPGLVNIFAALARIERKPIHQLTDDALWQKIHAEDDRLAQAAFDRWCLSFGAVAGDLALAHGAHAVVLGGGIVPRIDDKLQQSGFHARFVAKGRFEKHMSAIPIRRMNFPEPGLLGAAVAGLRHHGQ